MARYLNIYREIAERTHGYTARSEQIGWAAPIYVAETDAQAVDEARPHIEALFNKFLTLPFEMLFPPGYLSAQSLKNMRSVRRPAIQGGKVLDRGADRARHLPVRLGPTRCASSSSTATASWASRISSRCCSSRTLPRDLTEKNIRLFAREVLPALQALTDKDYAGMAVEAAQ